MAFIRRRTTRRGLVSTALVESYHGKSAIALSQTFIANLHGAESLAAALGRLAAKNEAVRKKRAELEPLIPHANGAARNSGSRPALLKVFANAEWHYHVDQPRPV
jgi:hypothetical protein